MSDAEASQQVSDNSVAGLGGRSGEPLVAVMGPTGSGKSELGLYLARELARELAGEIVNYDSIQMYRGFDVGSAKVPASERQAIAHHLIDIADAGTEITAGGFARLATEVVAGIRERRRLPILVGGTGFYLRALLDGLSPAPPRDPELRARLVELGERRRLALWRYLRRYDPAAAGRIHANDRQKLIRAIEIGCRAGRPASEVQAEQRLGLEGYRVLKIALLPDRAALQARLNARSEWMFGHGLLEETRGLLAGGVGAQAKPMLSLGYRQAVAVCEGRQTLEDAIRECQTRTRQYAKRQITWLRGERDLVWFTGFGWDEAVQKNVLGGVRAWLDEASTPFRLNQGGEAGHAEGG